MIDIHCHFLPGVDDGPKSMNQAIEMGDYANGEGVSAIIVTPHAFHSHFDTADLDVYSAVTMLQQELRKRDIALELYAGQEIRIFGELLDALEKGKALPLAESRYVLIEFPSDFIPAYTESLFFNLQIEGYIPIIAHPERNRQFAMNPKRLFNFVSSGVLSQITTSSLTGLFGKNVQSLAYAFLRNNLSHFVASDAHNLENRSFHWNDAKKLIISELGVEKWERYTMNAEAILKDEYINLEPPTLPVKNWMGKWKL